MDNQQEIVLRLYKRAAGRLNIDTKFEVQGHKISEKLNLKYHKCFLVDMDTMNSSTPFPMVPIDTITRAFRNPIVFHDLPRRDNKRNLTLSEQSRTGRFIFIIPKSAAPVKSIKNSKGDPVSTKDKVDQWIEKQAQEKKFIMDILKAKLYSSVEQTDLSTVQTNYAYSYEQKEEVGVPVREITDVSSIQSYQPTYLRSKEKFKGEEDGLKFLYVTVHTLGDLNDGTYHLRQEMKKMRLLTFLLGYTPIIVSKSKSKYFKKFPHREFSDKYFKSITTSKTNIKTLQEEVDRIEISALLDDYSYKNTLKRFSYLVPDKFKYRRRRRSQLKDVTLITRLIPSIQPRNISREWEKYFESLLKEYPLLKVCNLESSWRRPEWQVIKEIDDVIKEKRKTPPIETYYNKLSPARKQKIDCMKRKRLLKRVK